MASREGNLKSISINGVKMYSVASQQPSLASWKSSKKLKAIRKTKNYMQKLEVLHDLRFETATTKIKVTPDGEYLIASGIYPPQVKVYELRELGLKFERHLDSEIIDFQVLAEDYSKLAFLCADRSISLHAKYGKHYSLRIPRMGRDLAYDCWSCDLLCAASSPDVYRINLEQGRFLSSLNTQSPALNVVSRSKLHGLVACGGDDGAVECFDMRMRSSVGRIDAIGPSSDVDQEVTALEFDEDGGFLMAVGSSAGKVLLYDLRSSYPILVKDHMYGSPILDIKWHRTLNYEQPKLITSDNHVVRIWDPATGEGMTSIEPTAGTINDVCTFSGSGLIMLALDCSQIPSYFLPALGPAPKWCTSLENLTEELEEGGETTIYDHYKFLTAEQLERLNLTNLIGTNLVRAYMHGFFINYRLYKKAKDLVQPIEYDAYIEQRKREKLEAEFNSRITIKRKLPKVNRQLAARLETEAEGETDKKKKRGPTKQDLEDRRFEAMFTDKDYEIVETSREYLALHPMPSKNKPSMLVDEHFEPVKEDEDQSLSDSDALASSQASEDELVDGSNNTKRARVPRLYEIKDERHAEAFWNNQSLAEEDSLPMGDRVAALGDDQRSSRRNQDNVKMGLGGSREITFTTRRSAKYKEDREDREVRHEKRRGVQSLGLKPDRSGFQGRGRGRGGRGRGRGSRGRGRRGRD
ncbi:Nucleolar protein 10 [Quillaja saponaria]|uniref:Nucleolar protein 10 n=1 Tax=Quillaja saponaria TaxID=32244 RepID=A0AAD7PZM5_QUISA|nr:Nucleolar protein 10 [Quillaja saponaria]